MENKSCNNFISYVGLEEHEIQTLSSSRRNSLIENSIKLLPGEVLIAEAQSVLMFSPVSDLKQGISGVLSVTNFKLTFITSDDSNGEDVTHQQNHLYGYTDTCLTNIDEIYIMVGDKKRKLVPGNTVPSKVKGIFIICKNLRTWSFSFKFSPLGHGKNLLTALLHHAFPSRHQLLFAYDYKEAYYSSLDKNVQLFRDISDWQNELRRTLSNDQIRKAWRLSTVNAKFQLCPSLSQYVIVPASVTDRQLTDAAKHFQGNRPLVWSWTSVYGAALVKMSELLPTITERRHENIMFENIRKSHPQKMQPVVIELNKEINVKLIAVGFSKFISLCSAENIRQFWVQDNNFYSLLENTKWLKYISYCLQKAADVCDRLNLGYSVILQEGAGRDLCCVISSLVQLLLDPHFRTITGFQSLLQKEWVAGGHPFCDRLGHIVKTNSEKSPLFLLYLDCVWQLCQQYPTEFEFTETYLTTLWDTAHVSIFDTFIFNCERDRAVAAMDPNTPLVLRSVWDWREQFSDQDILLFYNPLFVPRDTSRTNSRAVIKPSCAISNLELWTQCYFRWIPALEIHNGGQRHVELYVRLLQNDVNQLKININGNCGSPVDKVGIYSLHTNIDSFYPFSNKRSGNTVSTPIMNSSILITESLLDAQSLITATD
ncbi:myotubularin-related protein 10-B isoform X1 [Harpegnathos saltator]|uniref:Myotubularin-related protein 10-B n=2 Tax=Harpegnathos saltator TaxID=610380 RepID=E2BET5_HARSA|nr:myotubularin-related protein 10-B isoform X1 [Harpegnathos saltator]EFN85801.1 Myotubularin-related protein 10-B [Harpegnathos saltator]